MAFNRTASDEALARQLNEGSHEAFDELMKRYKTRIYSFICRYVADRDEAYDLLQESFINIYQKIHLYDPSRKFSTWAFQIALNKCRDFGRKKSLARIIPFSSFGDRSSTIDFTENLTGQEIDPERILISKTELQILVHEISSLPSKLKAPLIMCVLEGIAQKECAEILEISTKAVETRISRARKKLTEKLRH